LHIFQLGLAFWDSTLYIADMTKVAIYCRVSTDKQSFESQVHELTEYAGKRQWEIEGVYTDQISGRKERRPGLDKLMEKARQRKVDIVLTWKLDRFGRSLKHLVNTLAELETVGVSFVSLRDNLDFTTPAGRFQFAVLAAVAEFEAAMIRERVKAGIERARARGMQLGRPSSTTEILQAQVFKYHKMGYSVRKVAHVLGVSKSRVSRILNAGS